MKYLLDMLTQAVVNNGQEATELLKDAIDLVPECDTALSNLLSYPLHSTLTRYILLHLSFFI